MKNYLCIIFLSVISPIKAHHAVDAAYDRNQLTSITGNVESIFWRNPHVVFEIIDEEGINWVIESGSINSLMRAGFDRTIIQTGDKATFLGAPSRRGLNALAAFTVNINDTVIPIWPQRAIEIGIEVRDVARETEVPSSEQSSNLFKVWSRSLRLQKLIATNAFAESFRTQWDPLADDPALLCQPPGMPSMMDNPYPIAFEEYDDHIILRLEEWDSHRVIWMKNNNAINDPKMGLSLGEWDGNKLIIKTNMIDYPYFDDLGTPLSEEANVIERFEPNEQYTVLKYSATIYNPEYFDVPATFEGQWEWVPLEKINRFDCALRQ
jgi:hypothetical protein